jgi:hypothetical protein
MKRFVFFILVLCLTCSVGYFFVVRPTDGDLLDIVPADSVVVMDWDSPAQTYQEFVNTPLGETLQGIDWPLILETSGLSTEDVTEAGNVITSWQAFARSLFFQEVFGARCVLAVLDKRKGIQNSSFYSGDQLPLNLGETVADVISSTDGTFPAFSLPLLRKNLVFLNRSGRKIALLHSFLTELPGTQQLPPIQYQGFTINGYLLENGCPVYFTTEKDLLIAAFDPAPLQQCLDLQLERILQKDGGMMGNVNYAAFKKRARGLENFFLYVDIARIKANFLNALSPVQAETTEGSTTSWFMEEGVQKAVLYHQSFQELHQITSIVHFDASALPIFQKSIYTRPPVENRKLSRMPANLLAYFWSNWLDLPAWWQMTKVGASGADVQRVDQFAATIYKYTEMDIEEFLALFGNRVGLNIKEIKTTGFLPIPSLCFCVEMTERRKIETLLKKYLADLPLHRNVVAGVPVISVMAAGGLMQPSYALLQDFFIIADGRDQIEDLLLSGGDMLVSDPDFLEVDMGLNQPNNLVFFARTAELLEGLKELAAWLGMIIAVRDEQAGFRSKILLDGAIIPLLDSLTMFKAQAIRSYTADGEIVVQATVLMTDE